MVSQDNKLFDEERNTRSIKELELEEWLVELDTTCVRARLLEIDSNLENKDLDVSK